MKISAVSIENYKRIKSIDLKIDADKLVVLIGGANANGKSSILDAFEAALGGKSAVLADPVRHGAEQAGIRIELDDGKLTVQRKINPDGSGALEVRDELGAVRSPQAMLDKLVGKRFLDPRAFLLLKPADQRAQLMALVDKDGKIDALDQQRDRTFVARTDVNRDLNKAIAERDRAKTSLPAEVPAPIDIAALSTELQAVGGKITDIANRRNRHDAARADRARATQRATEAQATLARAQAALAAAREAEVAAIEIETAAAAQVAEVQSYDELAQRTAEIQAQIAKAQEHNRTAVALESLAKRYAEIVAEVNRFDERAHSLTSQLAAVDAQKAAFLAAAKLPVAGLGVTSGGVTLNGVPLAQASGAEQLRVALALAVAGNNELRDIWIRDGALLDDDSMRAVAEQAAVSGCRVWIERVGDRDPGAVIIEDGSVKAPSNGATSSQGSLFA